MVSVAEHVTEACKKFIFFVLIRLKLVMKHSNHTFVLEPLYQANTFHCATPNDGAHLAWELRLLQCPNPEDAHLAWESERKQVNRLGLDLGIWYSFAEDFCLAGTRKKSFMLVTQTAEHLLLSYQLRNAPTSGPHCAWPYIVAQLSTHKA